MSQLLFISFLFLYPIISTASPPFKESWTTRLTINDFHLPIFELCKKYPILLDTGSKDSWLADVSCLNCPQRVNVCPKSGQIGEKITYFKGSVDGNLLLVNTCLGAYRFVCVSHAQGMQGLGAVGILGLKGVTGKGILKALMQIHGIQNEQFGIYQGRQENRLFLGQIPNQFLKSKIKISKTDEEWTIKLEGFNIFGRNTQIMQNHQIFFDTGSNMLILPSNIYNFTRKALIQQMKRNNCLEKSQLLIFSCKTRTIINESIKLKVGKDSQISLPLKELLQFQYENHKFRIQRGLKPTTIIVGGSLMKNYIVAFHLNGLISIYTANQKLFRLQIANFKMVLLQYAITTVFLAFLFKKGYQAAEAAIYRKIVI